MSCASMELIRAIQGVSPFEERDGQQALPNVEWWDRTPCDGRGLGDPSSVGMYACHGLGFNIIEDTSRPVTCSECLRAMRAATDPVRYDYLRERGLVAELPLVSEAA